MAKANSAQFLVARGQLSTGPLLLDVDQSRHARDVRRVRVGEQVNLTDGFGQLGTARVVEIPRRGSVLLEVKETWQVAPSVPQITVVQAVVHGEKLDNSIAMMTELGVRGFIPWLSERGMARSRKVTERWHKIVREATKQSGRAWLPEVGAPVIMPDLMRALAPFDQVVVGEPGASESLDQVKLQPAGSVAIVVGPEGGISPVEREQFESVGARFIAIGDHTLRSTTAGVALTAGLLALMRTNSVVAQ